MSFSFAKELVIEGIEHVKKRLVVDYIPDLIFLLRKVKKNENHNLLNE